MPINTGKKLKNEDMEEFIDRNYKIIMESRKAAEEERQLRPKYLSSETYFVPTICKHSRKIAESKGESIHNSLFQEARYSRDRKETLIKDEQKRILDDEMIGVTFQPVIKYKKRKKLARRINPIKYLNPNPTDKRYIETFKNRKKLKEKQKSCADVVNRLTKYSNSVRCVSQSRQRNLKIKNSRSQAILQIPSLNNQSKKLSATKRKKVIDIPSPDKMESTFLRVGSSVEQSSMTFKF
jgi:hypothetical protein